MFRPFGSNRLSRHRLPPVCIASQLVPSLDEAEVVDAAQLPRR
jgi:hypothetical protein